MTVNPTVIPATRSPRALGILYLGNQPSTGRRLSSIFLLKVFLALCRSQGSNPCRKGFGGSSSDTEHKIKKLNLNYFNAKMPNLLLLLFSKWLQIKIEK